MRAKSHGVVHHVATAPLAGACRFHSTYAAVHDLWPVEIFLKTSKLSFQHTINHRELGLSHNGTTSAMFNHHELHAHTHHTPFSKRLDKCDPNTPSISIAWESAAMWCTGYTKRSLEAAHFKLEDLSRLFCYPKKGCSHHITSRLEENTVGFMFRWSGKIIHSLHKWASLQHWQ